MHIICNKITLFHVELNYFHLKSIQKFQFHPILEYLVKIKIIPVKKTNISPDLCSLWINKHIYTAFVTIFKNYYQNFYKIFINIKFKLDIIFLQLIKLYFLIHFIDYLIRIFKILKKFLYFICLNSCWRNNYFKLFSFSSYSF